MKQVISTVTSKGQVTIPVEVRKLLRLKRGDKLAFVIEDGGQIRVEAPRYTGVASLRGAAGTLERPLSWDEVLDIAREDHLKDLQGGE